MSQDGSHGHPGTDASNDHGSAPAAADANTALSLGPAENVSNSGPLPGTPVVAEDGSKGKGDVDEPAISAGSTHSGAGLSKGNKRSAEQVAMATNDSDDVSNIPKGKRQKICGRRKKQLPHIINERERRKRMKGMFADLQALLPNVPEKVSDLYRVCQLGLIDSLAGDQIHRGPGKHRGQAGEAEAGPRAGAARAVAAGLEAGSSAAPPPNAAAQGPSSDLPQGWAWLPKQPPKPAMPQPLGFQTWSGANVVLSVANDYAFINVCVPRRSGVLLLVLSVLEKHRIDVITTHVGTDGVQSMFSIHARVNTAALQQLGGVPPASEDIYKLAVSEIMVWLSSY
ncbi:hypothetical protein PR202_ga01643 [Eleusine coracana subsp. coracana]|uniref:BHLH domain-containing protein n=1 Tax=Eleusine coracana subsp. coracana TaxID=191504 RepID=A0AAV5BIM7_ELECO|nr:hypothetical protein PR202_ga00956 [Eleusine coracana subsp. coracana]GJM85841.1 hypothetical protein PR202_ga01643 [Eleusine coracana subsp. coracana]